MRYTARYSTSSDFGKIEYFNEILTPPLFSNYLECGKIYQRAHFPQIVTDLFPFDLSSIATDNFAVMTSNTTPAPFSVSGPEGGGWNSPACRAFDNNASSAWSMPVYNNYAVCEFSTGSLLYTLYDWSVTYGGEIRNIKLEIFVPSLNLWNTVSSFSTIISGQRYIPDFNIFQQLEGFNKIKATIYGVHQPPIYTIEYRTVKQQDIQDRVITGFKVPEAPEKPGYKAYVNIDYRGISDRYI